MDDQSKLSEHHIDHTLAATFPASDPPSNSGHRTRLERQQRDAEAGQEAPKRKKPK